jgi:uncharacterized protein (DUF39 family)
LVVLRAPQEILIAKLFATRMKNWVVHFNRTNQVSPSIFITNPLLAGHIVFSAHGAISSHQQSLPHWSPFRITCSIPPVHSKKMINIQGC